MRGKLLTTPELHGLLSFQERYAFVYWKWWLCIFSKERASGQLEMAGALSQSPTGNELCHRVSQCACWSQSNNVGVGKDTQRGLEDQGPKPRPLRVVIQRHTVQNQCPLFSLLRAKQLKVVYWFSWQGTTQRENAGSISVLLLSLPHNSIHTFVFRGISSLSQRG